MAKKTKFSKNTIIAFVAIGVIVVLAAAFFLFQSGTTAQFTLADKSPAPQIVKSQYETILGESDDV